MCSELFRIPYEVAGVPIFGVGVLLALWAIATAASLSSLVRRYGWSGETLSSIPVLLMLGAAILFLPKLFPEGLPIRGYGAMLLAGIVSGVGLAMYRARKGGLDPELILSLAIWMVVGGVVGGRLFYVIEYWNESFAGKSLLEVVNIPEGGLVIYGGFFGAMTAFLAFMRNHRLPILAMADLIAPCMLVGLALGRIGCLLNGCCYGGACDLPWAVTFPQYASRYEAEKPPAARRLSPPYADQASSGTFYGFRLGPRDLQSVVVTHVEKGSPAETAGLKVGDVVIAVGDASFNSLTQAKELIYQRFIKDEFLRLNLGGGWTRPRANVIDIPAVTLPPRSRPVHPAQLYSAIDAALLAWLLWAFFPFRRHDGEAIALMLTIHPITRFLLEIIRVDEPAVFGTGLSISQNISVGLLACAAVMWWYLWRQPVGVTWPLVAEIARPAEKRELTSAGNRNNSRDAASRRARS